MHRYMMVLEYDGSEFYGWQKQGNLTTIEGILENEIKKFGNTKLAAAGRTDKGVHAKHQVVHFDLEKNYETNSIRNAMNTFLINQGIFVKNIEKVSNEFHARYSVKEKTYQYTILNSEKADVFKRRFQWQIKKTLDINKMRKAASLLIGMHNFSAFKTSECTKNPEREINDINLYKEENHIIIDIKGKSFLHNQVRIIVGTLYNIGINKIGIMQVKKALTSSDRKHTYFTAPAHGLCLLHISY